MLLSYLHHGVYCLCTNVFATFERALSADLPNLSVDPTSHTLLLSPFLFGQKTPTITISTHSPPPVSLFPSVPPLLSFPPSLPFHSPFSFPSSRPFHLPSHAERYRDLYAFQYRPKDGELVKQSSGWALYDAGSEYSRMGVPNQHWKATALNENYEVSGVFNNNGQLEPLL